jgi:hypothetical protein
MSRRPRAAALSITSEVIADYGPTINRTVLRDDVEIDHAAGDPDQPKTPISRARVRVIYHAMWADGRLDDAHHEAADRLCIALEQISGAHGDRSDGGAYWQRAGITMAMLTAAEHVRNARDWLGPVEADWLEAVVGANRVPGESVEPGRNWYTPRQFDAITPRIAGRMRDCLGVLAEKWGM